MKEPVAPASLASEAYEFVKHRILHGELPMGQVISRRKIAAELGMSFLPVSMALLRLESEGLLESRPRGGTRVLLSSPGDGRGHYVVREALEVQAAKLFAQMATAGERADLQKLAARVDALAVEASARLQFVVWPQKLPRRIAECTRCPALSSTIDQTNVLAAMWFCVAQQPPADGPRRRHPALPEVLGPGTVGEAPEGG